MPQIWVTYEEMGAMYGQSAMDARSAAIEAGWDRRQCGDGLSRVKLPEGAAHSYMVGYVQAFDAAPTERNPVHDLQQQVEHFARRVLNDMVLDNMVVHGVVEAPADVYAAPRAAEVPARGYRFFHRRAS